MLGAQSSEMSSTSTLLGSGHIRGRSIELAMLNNMYRLRLPMSTIHQTCEAKYAIAQSTDNDFTEHYEFNWCLRSLLGGRLLMQSGTQYHNGEVKTACEEQASL